MSSISKGRLESAGAACGRSGDSLRRLRVHATGEAEHHRKDRHGFHEQLGSRAGTDGQRPGVLSTHRHAVGTLVARLHANLLSRLQLVAVEKAQESGVLVGHAPHHQRHVERTGQQRVQLAVRDGAMGIRNRIAVRIHARPAQHGVHALDEPLGDRVFELLGFVVHLVPAHPHDIDEKQLDETVPPYDERGEPLAGRRQLHSRIRLVDNEPRLRQRLHHRRRRPRCDPHRRGELTHRHEIIGIGQRKLLLVNHFQVIFDRA